MLKRMTVKNFTVFKDEIFEFSPGLNVIVGENAVGKSHLLKLGYSLVSVGATERRIDREANLRNEVAYIEKMIGVFRPKLFTNLIRKAEPEPVSEVSIEFDDEALNCSLGLNLPVKYLPSDRQSTSFQKIPGRPIYFPTRELLTICPGFVSLYESRFLPFEETWRDTCVYLGVPLLRDVKGSVAQLLSLLEAAIGAKVVVDDRGDEFYLESADGRRTEMHLVAEGYRKLAMLIRLVANGMIAENGYLFWDEPESNLNAKLIRVVAEVIVELGRHGVQVFIATHSLFLLRELEILLADKSRAPVPVHYIGLAQGADGVVVSQGEQSADLAEIVVLDESINQASRYMALED